MPDSPFHLETSLYGNRPPRPVHPTASSNTNTDHHHEHTDIQNSAAMGREKERPHLDIILDKPYIVLKGTGPDVEQTRLSGHVSLFLTEATSIKEITLQFRGKARIPMPASESLINSSASITYVVCNHDWSFLEGDKKHSRTLKAGRHFFPFSLEIGGSLPSSISTPALGGASVAYKLRAVAARPGLSIKLQHITTVHIVRAFTPEALEYQQTLEIENTWPDKLMYAIMLPHKAWAAGDTLVAVIKFSPLAKGVQVQSIVSNIIETTKIFARSGSQEDTRVVASVRHEIVGGRAVEVDLLAGSGSGSGGAGSASGGGQQHERGPHLAQAFGFGSPTASRPSSRPSSPLLGRRTDTDSSAGPSSSNGNQRQRNHDIDDGFQISDVITYVRLPIPATSNLQAFSSSGPSPSTSQPATPYTSTSASYPSSMLPSSSSLTPTTVTPTHTLEPITVSHRVRWSIFIQNRDGHISELRCSLPVNILDGRVLADARAHSGITRRMILESVGLGAAATELGLASLANAEGGEQRSVDGEVPGEGDRELPSYTAHVRDRVANMFLPEAATMRVSNPWVGRVGGSGSTSPAEGGDGLGGYDNPSLADGFFDPLQYTTDATHHPRGTTSNPISAPHSRGSRSGRDTPGGGGGGVGMPSSLDAYAHAHAMSHLPHAPVSGESTPLDWVNSELLMSLSNSELMMSLSLSDDPLRRFERAGATANGGVNVAGAGAGAGGSRTGSRWGSRSQSRVQSRSGSPERSAESSGSGSGSGNASAEAVAGPSAGAAEHPHAHGAAGAHGGHAGHGQAHSHPVRNFQSLFKATMKPFTSLSHHGHGHPHPHPHGHQHGHEHSNPSRDRDPLSAAGPSHSVSSSALSNAQLNRRPLPSPPLPSHHPPYSQSTPALPYTGEAHTKSSEAGGLSPIAPSPSTTTLNADPLAYSPHSASTSALAPAPHHPGLQHAHRPGSGGIFSSSSSHPVGPAMLHRALTEVPDYSIASRGFLGGVPPLSSAHGLPSYEQAAREGRRGQGQQQQQQHQSHVVFAVGTRDNEAAAEAEMASAAGTSSREWRGTVSDSDVAGRFTRAGADVPGGGSMQRLEGTDEEEEDDATDIDVGIEIHIRRH